MAALGRLGLIFKATSSDECEKQHRLEPYSFCFFGRAPIHSSSIQTVIRTWSFRSLFQLMRLSGLGAMKPNIVVISFHEKTPTETTLVETCLLKDLRFSRIDRAEVVEYFTAADYMPRVSISIFVVVFSKLFLVLERELVQSVAKVSCLRFAARSPPLFTVSRTAPNDVVRLCRPFYESICRSDYCSESRVVNR